MTIGATSDETAPSSACAGHQQRRRCAPFCFPVIAVARTVRARRARQRAGRGERKPAGRTTRTTKAALKPPSKKYERRTARATWRALRATSGKKREAAGSCVAALRCEGGAGRCRSESFIWGRAAAGGRRGHRLTWHQRAPRCPNENVEARKAVGNRVLADGACVVRPGPETESGCGRERRPRDGAGCCCVESQSPRAGAVGAQQLERNAVAPRQRRDGDAVQDMAAETQTSGKHQARPALAPARNRAQASGAEQMARAGRDAELDLWLRCSGAPDGFIRRIKRKSEDAGASGEVWSAGAPGFRNRQHEQEQRGHLQQAGCPFSGDNTACMYCCTHTGHAKNVLSN